MTTGLPLHMTLSPLKRFRGQFDAPSVVGEVRKVWSLIQRSPYWSAIRRDLKTLVARGDLVSLSSDLTGDTIRANVSTTADYDALVRLCNNLISWRTGPYQIGSLSVDTEWRSHMKWSRISPLIPQLLGKRVADVGCSNGYFMFKLSTLRPDITIGFDPIERCWLQFALIQSILRTPHLAFVPMGILSLEAFKNFFDFILCMGVLYHQRDHALAVKRLFEATRPGGRVLLESLVVPTALPLIITPPDRYAKMRNVWTIPSASHLQTLFEQAGFKDVAVHSFGPLSTDEQRRTSLAPFESLADFLDPKDPTKTVEGHPAPHTAAVIGRRY